VTLATTPKEDRDLAIDLIDDPALPSRSQMDDEKLEQLAASIRAVGLIERIVVARVGDRYEVIAGHRRRIACQRAGLVLVPCVVYAEKPADLLTIQAHENSRREDLNPADEGLWFTQLLDEQCNGDIERLAGLVGETVNYCDGRLALVRGDARVFEALRRGDIKIGVAHELNKVEDAHYRNYFLSVAIQSGATLSAVSGWILDWKRNQVPAAPSSGPVEESAPGIAQAPRDPFTCEICGLSNNVHLMRQINVHQHCKMAILDPLLGKTDGSPT
jgi:ParB family transcriptional regulator, chromosome partitioning protein